MIRRQKFNDTRKLPAEKLLYWNRLSYTKDEIVIDDYRLVVEQVGLFSYMWEMWYKTELMIAGDVKGDCTTIKQAKNKATYRMEKHKKSLIRKTVNNAS